MALREQSLSEAQRVGLGAGVEVWRAFVIPTLLFSGGPHSGGRSLLSSKHGQPAPPEAKASGHSNLKPRERGYKFAAFCTSVSRDALRPNPIHGFECAIRKSQPLIVGRADSRPCMRAFLTCTLRFERLIRQETVVSSPKLSSAGWR